MAFLTEWTLRFKDLMSPGLDKLQGELKQTESSFGNLRGAGESFGSRMMGLNQTAQALSGVQSALEGVVGPGAEFEKNMAMLSAITDTTGPKLDLMGESARRLALEFGGSAADNVGAFQTILSKLGPQIADQPAALEEMARNVATLSKATGDDAAASVDALTTALLQFQVDLNDPIAAAKEMTVMMNVMAAGAQQGAAEVPRIADALKVAGVAASGAKVSFAETNAVLQVLAAGGKEGAEAGTALRNVLGTLGKGRFIPKDTLGELEAAGVDIKKLQDTTVPLSARLKELTKIQNDAALVGQFFGVENAAAASIMLRSIPTIEKYTKEFEGTTTATDQAKVNMNTFSAQMDRFKSQMQDWGISVFNATKPILPFVIGASQMASGVAALAPAAEIAGRGFGAVRTFASNLPGLFGKARLAVVGFNAALLTNPVTAIAVGVAALGAAMAYFYNTNEDVRASVDGLFANFQPVIAEVKAAVSGLAKSFGPMLKSVGAALAPVLSLAASAAGELVAALSPVLQKLAPIVGFVVKMQLANLLLPFIVQLKVAVFVIGKVTQAINAVAAAADWFREKLDGIGRSEFAQDVRLRWTGTMNWLRETWASLTGWWTDFTGSIRLRWTGTMNWLKELWASVTTFFSDNSSVFSGIAVALAPVLGIFKLVWDLIQKIVKGVQDLVAGFSDENTTIGKWAKYFGLIGDSVKKIPTAAAAGTSAAKQPGGDKAAQNQLAKDKAAAAPKAPTVTDAQGPEAKGDPTRIRNVTVNIARLNGIENLTATTIRESIANIEQMVTDAIVRAVRDAEYTLSE